MSAPRAASPLNLPALVRYVVMESAFSLVSKEASCRPRDLKANIVSYQSMSSCCVIAGEDPSPKVSLTSESSWKMKVFYEHVHMYVCMYIFY